MGVMTPAHHASVLAIEQRRGAVLLGIVECYTLCQVRVAHSAPLWNLLIPFSLFFRSICPIKEMANKFNGLYEWVRDVRSGLRLPRPGRTTSPPRHGAPQRVGQHRGLAVPGQAAPCPARALCAARRGRAH